jgi:outer membrane receptor protein involved in Fe transport
MLPLNRLRPSGRALLSVILWTGPLAAQQAAPDTAKIARRRTSLDEITVTATRTDRTIRTLPANVAVITKESSRLSAAQNVPDLLRVLPGFTTRDHQSQIVASPARSAAAFRGLGTTSASRALVLLDGIPMNEPFAGWVHWPRVPLSLVERIEAVRGGGSGVWGSRSLGGVINLVTLDPAKSHLELAGEGGSFGTYRGSASASYGGGKLRALGASDWYDTDGFVITRPDQIGPIDIPSYQRSKTAFGRVTYDPTPNLRLNVGASYLDELISTGTRLKRTNVEVGEVRGGLRWAAPGGGVLTLNGYRTRTNMDIYSSSESLDRQTETPSFNQFDIPSTALGAGLQWSQLVGRRHELTAGADWSRVDGSVHEDLSFQETGFTRRRRTAGEQLNGGLYVQDGVDLGRGWRLLASGRVDRFRNEGATRKETDLRTGTVVLDTVFAGERETRFSYSLGVRRQVSAAVALRASGYGAFRAPTLNEMYKPARESGNVIVEAGGKLRSERLTGGEVGADLNLGPNLVTRFTLFLSTVSDPIIDATVGTAGSTARVIAPCGNVPAGGTCRLRENVGSLRTSGLESEIEAYPHRDLSLWLSYTFNPTRFSAPPSEPGLDGNASRGAARHIASMIITYWNPSVLAASTTVRYVGSRFDDDLNNIRLDPFWVVDVKFERQVFRTTSAYFKVENLFDREYEITRSAGGFARRGLPRFAIGGFRVRW